MVTLMHPKGYSFTVAAPTAAQLAEGRRAMVRALARWAERRWRDEGENKGCAAEICCREGDQNEGPMQCVQGVGASG